MNDWIRWTKQIHAIAQIGKTFTQDPYDLDRYRQLTLISEEMFAKLADAPIGRVENFFIPDQGYATPKVDLRAAVFKDDKILLVREITDGRWSLPGGWADVNESPRTGIEREVQEESGYQVRVSRLAAIKDRSLHGYQPQYPYHIYKLFFVCEWLGGEARSNIEVSEIDFFSLTELPPLSIGRVLGEDVDLMYQYHQDPNRLPYID